MPSLSENLAPLWSGAPARVTPARPGYDIGLLLLRLTVGATFVLHGAQKLFGWFGGRGLDGTARLFAERGYPSGRTMAAVTGLSETAGGIGLILGLLTPLAGAALIGVLVNALAVKWSGGFFAPSGVEYPLTLLASATALTLAGPGRCAVDRFLPGLRDQRLTHGVTALALGVTAAAAVLVIRG
jgi:putative oxidoreductase